MHLPRCVARPLADLLPRHRRKPRSLGCCCCLIGCACLLLVTTSAGATADVFGSLPSLTLLWEAAGWLWLLLLLPLPGASCLSSAAQCCIIHAYVRLPLNSLSRAWGRCHHRPLPRAARAPLYRLYSRLCSCDLSEASCDRLAEFASLAEFFARDLRPGVRPVCPASELVSPADGRLLSLGRVRAGHLEQGFLGPEPLCAPHPRPGGSCAPAARDAEFQSGLRHRPDSDLFHCTVYLAPGDYHKFHSPADWTVRCRRHFPGRLLSVAPAVAARVAGLLCANERAVYTGAWRHGFLCLAAVGATGVGSIGVKCDPDLATNQSGARAAYYDKRLTPPSPQVKGQLFGEFHLGSTVVLLFEAPRDFEFAARPGQRIRVGEALARRCV